MVTSGAQNLSEKAEKFLKSVQILSPLTDAQRAKLADAMVETKYTDGECVVSNPNPNPSPSPYP